MIDKEKLKRRFSRNAKNYDKYANVQKIMGSLLIDNLPGFAEAENAQIKNILEIGCGTGYVTQQLASKYPHAQITAVDIAPGMIELVQSRIKSERIDFVCADIEETDLSERYDLIVSNATFQWFNDLEKTIDKLIGALNEKGTLCFSIFGKNTFRELHDAFDKARCILGIDEPISPGQTFFSAGDLEQLLNSLICQNHQGALVHSFESYEHEHFDCCIDFLNSVKKIGANNSQSSTNGHTPGFIDKVIEIYDKDYSAEDKVVATYHNLFFYMSK